MKLRPTVIEERWLLLLARHPELKQAQSVTDKLGGWHTVGFMTRLALFLLGCIAAVAGFAVLELLRVPQVPLVAGLLAIGVAEWLVVSRQLSHTGIEEALEICGVLALVYWFASETLSWAWQPEMLSVAIACGLAGWRLRNPLFTTIAAISVAWLFKGKGYSSDGVFVRGGTLWAGVYCYCVALTALWLGRIHYQRPFNDRVLDWLVVVMPVAGYIVWTGDSWWSFSNDAPLLNLRAVIALLLFGCLAFTSGIQRRTHAPLVAVIACVACMAYELRSVSGLSLQQRLILWGVLTLIVALLLDRWLRNPRKGMTSVQFDNREGPLDLLPLAGAALSTPVTAAPTGSGMQGEGGEFGGGGASGRF